MWLNFPPETGTSHNEAHLSTETSAVKTSVKMLCFVVLNLEMFDSFVFHRQYFTAAFRQAHWHPYPRAVELSKEKEGDMWDQIDVIFHIDKLKAKGYFTIYQERSF